MLMIVVYSLSTLSNTIGVKTRKIGNRRRRKVEEDIDIDVAIKDVVVDVEEPKDDVK